MPKTDIALVDIDTPMNLSSEDIPRCCGSSKRRKMASSLHITNLPEGIFEHVAKYLAAPSILCAAVAFTASSMQFYSMSNRKDMSSQSKVLLSTGTRNVLDFGDVEDDSLASKISDADLAAMLVCINAVSNIKTLRLTGCVSINGQGLAPLRGSAVLKEIDLSLVRRKKSPIITPAPNILEEDVLPILDSIINTEGNALEILTLPKTWRNRQLLITNQFLERFNNKLEARRHTCSRCTVLCHETGTGFSITGSWWKYGVQNFSCNECRLNFCHDCETITGGPYVSCCTVCEAEYCHQCNPMKFCDVCERDICNSCSTVVDCEECGTPFCDACAPKFGCGCSSGNLCMGCVSCSYCGDQFCDNCSPVNMCECWDGPRCEDCAVRAGKPDCCGETIAATACEECIGFVQCEGCPKSNCLRCINEKEYDVECCEDCGREFCHDCRLKECSSHWDSACRKCAEKVGVILPKRSSSVYYMYHSANWDSTRAANPTAWFGELCSIIAKQFKSLSKEERAYWNNKARKEKEDYKQHIKALEQEFGKVNLSTNASVSSGGGGGGGK